MSDFYWTKDIDEAKREQRFLVDLVKINESTFDLNDFRIGLAIGTAYEENTKTAFAVCKRFDKNGRTIGDYIIASKEADFDYRPGLLVFRVGPAICQALNQIHDEIDKISLFLFDGQGIAHSIGFGLASHFGVLFNKPSIGVTKKALFGEYSTPSRGSYTYLKHPKTKSIIGYCVSMGGESFFMSPGHRITLKRSLDVVRMVSGKGYLPHPIRIVHEKANKIAREHWIAYKKML